MILKKVFGLTAAGIIADAVVKYIEFAKARKHVSAVFYSDELGTILSGFLNVGELKRDWNGRLYCIVNPMIGKDGRWDLTSLIYETRPGETGSSLDSFVERWVAERLSAVRDLFRQRSLFGHLEFDVTPVGPPRMSNFLFIAAPSGCGAWIKARARLAKRITVLVVLSLIAAIILI